MSKSGEQKPFFKHSLKRTLIFWFLILSLFPLVLAMVVRGVSMRTYIKGDAEKRLNLALRLKTLEVTIYYDHIIDTVSRYARVRMTREMIQQFKGAAGKEKQFKGGFKENNDYLDLLRRHEPYLTFLKETIGSHDLLIMDTSGNILTSVAGKSEFSGNILRGVNARTKLASSIRRSLSTGKVIFSDYGLYPVLGDEVSFGFVIAPITDESDHIHGLFIVQLLLSRLDEVMTRDVGGDTISDIYITGENLKYRSNLKRASPRIPHSVSGVLSDSFAFIKGVDRNIKHPTITFEGANRKKTFARFRHIRVGEFPYAVVAELTSKSNERLEAAFLTMMAGIFFSTTLFVIFFSKKLAKRWTRPINQLAESAQAALTGNLDQRVIITDQMEIGHLSENFNRMLVHFRNLRVEDEEKNWIKTGQMALHNEMRGEQELKSLGKRIIRFIARYIDVPIGILYLETKENTLEFLESYGHSHKAHLPLKIPFGEGVIGQVAVDKEMKMITDLKAPDLKITSSLVEVVPRNILLTPILHDDLLVGVMEFGSLSPITRQHKLFLEYISENVAITLKSALSRKHLGELIEKMKLQTEKLKKREEELHQSNIEFKVQTKALKVSENLLKKQQETLLDRNLVLEKQKKDIEDKNQELIRVRKLLEEKARDLERSNRYKTEFLTNMSHELRTPLNSILLLSNHLFENRGGHLNDDEITAAKTIHDSGSELLEFINEILDLSKIEAGKMEHLIETIALSEFVKRLVLQFKALAVEKSLAIETDISDHLPDMMHTDQQHLGQILKNFIANALKFTEKGKIVLRVFPTQDRYEKRQGVTFAVEDTGVGIPLEKQSLIFEAFQQADGSINRTYGGTGLGLSISTKLATLLGGEIALESIEGKGSTFFLHLPFHFPTDQKKSAETPYPLEDVGTKNQGNIVEAPSDSEPLNDGAASGSDHETISDVLSDDRDHLVPQDLSVLIIGCKIKAVRMLREKGRQQGWKCVLSSSGKSALELIEQFHISAVMMDLRVTDLDGWSLLTLLKEIPEKRHIPVVLFAEAEKKIDANRSGAADFITTPFNETDIALTFAHIERIIMKKRKDLLLVEDDVIQQKMTAKVIESDDVTITCVEKAEDAITQIESGKYDAVILDIGLPDFSGFEVLQRVRSNEALSRLPIIVFTGRDLTREEKVQLDGFAQSIVLKKADSHRKLLDDTTRFLHRRYDRLSDEQQKMLKMINDQENIFSSKRLLLVDDDMRNVFSLKQILQEKGFEVFIGKNGLDGLAMLDRNPDIDVVLMDIVMPKMDGYTAIGKIRDSNRFRDLPVIALTAKAMREDRGKCIAAGASDYLAKPVNLDRLFSMLRTWLY